MTRGRNIRTICYDIPSYSNMVDLNIVSKNLRHLPISASFHPDIVLHIPVVRQWRVRLMHSLIQAWFLSPFQLPNNQCGAYSQQRCKHQYCCAWDCILQILFSSYLISLSFNQSSVTKIRSISISSPCHFYFVLYCFIQFSWSPLPLFVPLRSVQSQRPLDVVNRSAQSRCPLDILWSSLRYGRGKADIHRMSCTLVFALIRVRKH